MSIGVAVGMTCLGPGSDPLNRLYAGLFCAVLTHCALLAVGLVAGRPATLPLRRALSISHHWMGAMLGGVLFVICLSGALSVLKPELRSWEMPTERQLAQAPIGLDDLLVQALAAFPEADSLQFDRPEAGPGPWHVQPMRSQQRSTNPAPTLSVPPVPAVHGDLTGIVTRLHNTFFAGFPGRVFVSLFGFALGALIVGGVVLHPRQEGTLWRLRLRAGLRTAAYDAHRLLGLWLAPLLLLIAVTGVFSGLGALATLQLAPFAFPEQPGQVMQALMQPYARPASGHRAPMASLDELMLRHRRMNPDFRVQGISVHHWGDAHAYATLRGTQRWQLSTAIFERYHYALADLSLLRHDSAARHGPFTQGFIAIQPLHFARYADAASRWLHALAGLAGAVLAASGTWLWLKRHANDGSTPYLRPWLSGMTLGLVLACSAMLAITALTPDSWPSRERWQAMGFGLTWAGALICCLLPGKWRARLPTTLLRLAAVLLAVAAAASLATQWRAAWQAPWPALSINVLLLSSAIAFWGTARKLETTP
ncbi:PepSY-associated TM helix domain-containing protein [Pseudomonas aeruginosa]|nr:PepSY-associated TM helix domain-containing protein [Pseudomonas aeruginosa]